MSYQPNFSYLGIFQKPGWRAAGVRTCLETTLLYQNRTVEELAVELAICERELLVAWDAICAVGRRVSQPSD